MLIRSSYLIRSHYRTVFKNYSSVKGELLPVLNRNALKEKYDKIIASSNELIGFDEIDKLYKSVSSLQENLHKIQIDRSAVQLQIASARNDLTNLQTSLQEHKRGEPKYLELLRREFDVIQHKNQLEENYSILDQKERELFSHLQAKINILHETSRTHTRQWGIITTVIGALLGIVGTSISAYYRNKDIRRVQESLQAQFQVQVDQITKDTNEIVKSYSTLIEHLSQIETTLKESAIVKPKDKQQSGESWAGYFKRKSIYVWRLCTFQSTN